MSALFRLVLGVTEYKQLALALRDDASASLIQHPTELPHNKKELYLSRDQVETILDVLGDLLCAKGITDVEINAYGLWLEPLIDLVNEPLQR